MLSVGQRVETILGVGTIIGGTTNGGLTYQVQLDGYLGIGGSDACEWFGPDELVPI